MQPREHDIALIRKILETLSVEIGPRFGGTDGEHRAAFFLRDAFDEAGAPAELQRYGFIGWQLDQPPVVRVTDPEVRELRAAPIVYSSSTPLGGVSGLVEPFGIKRLIPGLYEMQTFAVRMSDGDIAAKLVDSEAVDAIPLLNPDAIYREPLIAIAADDAQYLHRLCGNNKVHVTVEMQARLVPDAIAYNVIAKYRGKPESERRFVVNAHYDTQLDTPGCYDNASGVAGLFGLLSRLQEQETPVNVDFVAVASEEIGLIGSSYLARDLVERGEMDNIDACICFDQISAGERLWLWAGPETLRDKVIASTQRARLGRYGEVDVDAPMKGCDMWPFWVEGIPAVLFMWWRLDDYHRRTDTIEKVEMGKLTGCIEAAYYLLCDLGGVPA